MPPQKYLELLASLDGFISSYCKHHCLSAEEATSFFNRLSEHAMLRPEEVVRNVNAAAQRLWTSPLKLEVNRSIREDDAAVVQHLRSINMLCIVRRDPSKQIFPPRMFTFRGGELPLEHAVFLKRARNTEFRAFFAEGKTPMKGIVELDPRGSDALQFRCEHVNFCENSDVPGEEEFLFAPYSVFTVI